MDVLKSGRKRFQTLKNPGIFGQNVAKESGRSMKINNVDVPRVGVHLALGVRVGRTYDFANIFRLRRTIWHFT